MKGSKLSIKAIIRWEQLTGKSFSLMDYTCREDVEKLLYTMAICGHPDMQNYPFEVFQQTLCNEKITRKILKELEMETSVLAQYQKKVVGQSATKTDESLETIGNIVSTLIMSGLDAHYALNEMELCDLPLYVEAYERKRKEDMESARIWTYLTILPHIDAKKLKNGAKDIIVFPWEQEEKETENEITEFEVDRFEKFMKYGKNFLNN